VDRFKRINDTHGHATGDELLKSIAHRLSETVRESDTVSRHGGDEFVVLLPEVACGEDAALGADKLLAAIALPHRVADQDLHVTASVGIAVYPNDGTDAATLLRKRTWPCCARSRSDLHGRHRAALRRTTPRIGALPHRPGVIEHLKCNY